MSTDRIFDLQPWTGAGPLLFTHSISELARILGYPNHIDENRFSSGSSYCFCEDSIMVDVDENLRPKAFEFYSPQVVTYEGVEFIGVPFCQAQAWFTQRDSGLEFDGASLISRKLGIGIFSPSAGKNPSEPVCSVILFIQNYYD